MFVLLNSKGIKKIQDLVFLYKKFQGNDVY